MAAVFSSNIVMLFEIRIEYLHIKYQTDTDLRTFYYFLRFMFRNDGKAMIEIAETGREKEIQGNEM